MLVRIINVSNFTILFYMGSVLLLSWYFEWSNVESAVGFVMIMVLDVFSRVVKIEETIRKNADEDIEARKLVRQWLVDKGVLPAGKVDPPTREG
jgi:hypothetical protein